MDEKRKQVLDDMFDAFSILAGGNYVSLYDVEGKLTRYSSGAVELFGLPGEYIPEGAYDWTDYVHPEDRKRYTDIMSAMFATGTLTYDLTYRVRMKDGDYGRFRFVGAVIRKTDGTPSFMGGMIVNEGMLENTDAVTILRNQYGFFNDLPELMKKGSTILMLGVSRFARINEVHGYSHGNHVLQQIGWQIQENAAGGQGSVYRLEGARFAFVSDSMNAQQMAVLYRKIRRKLQTGLRVDDVRHTLTLNGGMISTKGVLFDSRTLYACLSYAYKVSKSRKHGELVDFNGGAGSVSRDFELLEKIHDCVVDDCAGFSLHYQPVVGTADGKLMGVEALVRWRQEPYGEVAPGTFMPVLEQDFAFEELADWILLTALSDGRKLVDKDPSFIMGVNISAVQLEDSYFIETLQQLLKRTGFPAGNLCLEFTKDCRLLDISHVKAMVESLHEKGIRVIIDDFGSGYDSLDFLKELSADFVKFDNRLVRGIVENERDRQALQHLAEMADAYGPHVCVKGVETEAMRDILRQFPIRSMQGYLYSKPLPYDELVKKYF